MDGKSRWDDNIIIERWFRSFKYEEAYLTQYANLKEARQPIKKYIHTYNFKRHHSAIDDQAPATLVLSSNVDRLCHGLRFIIKSLDFCLDK